MYDPNVVDQAPRVSLMLGSAAECEQGLSDRARGVMLGLAAGNVLGLPMEFWWRHQIEREYPDGVVDIDPREKHRPMDDDLAQAVELAGALLEGGDYVERLGERLVIWALENGRGIGFLTRRVVSLLEAGYIPPEAARIDYEENPIAPNGAVMRCAPVAIARFRQPKVLVGDSAATSVVTHYAVVAQWSCIIANAIIALLLKGVEPDLSGLMQSAAADGCPDLLGTARNDGIPTHVLESIVEGAAMPKDVSWLWEDQKLIGHSLIALQAGMWCAVTPLGFEAALRQVVEAGGDTDTNGAVAGAVLGAKYGASAIPSRWLDSLPQRRRIEDLADRLLDLAG